MLNKKQKEDLLFSLSSFYRDFLPIDNNLIKLYDIYSKTIDYVWTVYGETLDANSVTTTRTLATIPYFKINIDSAVYDLNMARVIARLPFERQIEYLDREGLFASLVFENKDNAGDPAVYSMRLFTNFGDEQPLYLYEDYFLKTNRLYLLPKYIQNRRKATHYLHAFDIKVNDYTLEKNHGTLFNLEAGPLLPRHEYRDSIEAYMRAFQGQMTIRSLKDAIKLATKWPSFKVEDRLSPDLSPKKLVLYNDWIISPNKFLVSLPEELIPDKIKINIIRALMSEIKEADKDYMIFFDIERIDPNKLPMYRYPTVHYQRGEVMLPEGKGEITNFTIYKKEYPLDVAGRYDTAFYYEYNLKYDDPPANEIISLKHTGRRIQEKQRVNDWAQITEYISPRIPRNFRYTKDSNTGDITFSLSSNPDETTSFELYHSDSEFGDYVLVETLNNDSNTPTLTFQHSAKDSAKRYYKSRAISEDKQSLFTLPINVDTV